jgi:hypothetical protein
VVELIRSRAVMLHCTTSLADPGSNPTAGTFNQTVHPSGVVELVAISVQWVTTVEGREGKGAAARWLAYGLCSLWCKLPYVGFLQSAVNEACLRVHMECKLLTFT